MKLSPLDIQHMEFATAMNGYAKRPVREFLERVAESYEEVLRENQRAAEEMQKLQRRLEELQSAEQDLKRAVIAAERIGNEMKVNAKREAELLLREAEGRRDVILRDAQLRAKEAQLDIARLERERDLFREQFRGMLKAFERSLDHVGLNGPQRRAAQARTATESAAAPVKNAVKPS